MSDLLTSGNIIRRGDAGYESARRRALWNQRVPSRFPELIVQARTAQDVQAAVAYARGRGLRVSSRSGGHSWCGSPLRDGGLLIDLRALRGLTVDPASRTAEVGPAVTSGELARSLSRYELAFPVGHCPSVGLGGYLLSGGLGWNSNVWGYGAYSVKALDVVDAEGELVTVTSRGPPDLLWAARGAGPGFPGVVTGFQLDVYPLPAIATTSYLVPLSAVAEVAAWAEEVGPCLPPEIELTLLLVGTPTDRKGGTTIEILCTAFCASTEDAMEQLTNLDSARSPPGALLREVAAPTPFETLHRIIDAASPPGHRYAADTAWSSASAGDVVLMLAEVPTPPSSAGYIVLSMQAARPGRESLAEAAFSMEGDFWIACYDLWDDPSEDELHDRWVREVMRSYAPLTHGHYIGEVDFLAYPDRAERSFSQEAWKRLSEVRRRLDPAGLFFSYLEG